MYQFYAYASVNNFQSIRNDLFQEVKGIQDKEKREVEMGQFAEELDRQNNQRYSLFSTKESLFIMWTTGLWSYACKNVSISYTIRFEFCLLPQNEY